MTLYQYSALALNWDLSIKWKRATRIGKVSIKWVSQLSESKVGLQGFLEVSIIIEALNNFFWEIGSGIAPQAIFWKRDVFVLPFPIWNMLFFTLESNIFACRAWKHMWDIWGRVSIKWASQLSECLNYPSEKNNKQNREKSQLSECLN